jgi:hypothetical protein
MAEICHKFYRFSSNHLSKTHDKAVTGHARYRNSLPEPCLGCIYAADRGEGQCHPVAEAQACGSDCRLRQPGCPGGKHEIRQDLQHLFLSSRGGSAGDCGGVGVLSPGGKAGGNDDPLFPVTRVALGSDRQFGAAGLSREHWSNATPIRKIFREASVSAGLPYFNPHSFRNTLVQLGQEVCKTPEQFKAWSQNLGHEKVLTTFLCYGEVAYQRQGEIIRHLAMPQRIPPERPRGGILFLHLKYFLCK